jgi:NAD+ synthase (glutamine-hydrolysing)
VPDAARHLYWLAKDILMKNIRVAAVELNQTPLDWYGNLDRIRGALEEARRVGATIVCLPELCITGYGCEDEFSSPGLLARAWKTLEELQPHTKGMVVSVGLPLEVRNAVFNTSALLVDGRIAGFVGKQFLAGDGLHYEPRWFKPWPAGTRLHIERNGQQYPIGDLYFDVGGVRIGYEICEDAWVAQRPGALLALKGIDIILNPSASHFAFHKIGVRKRFVMEGSRAFGCTYVYANLLGNEAGRAVYDGGGLIATKGQLVAIGPRFRFDPFRVTTAVVDIEATRLIQSRTGSFRPALAEDPAECVHVAFNYPALPPERTTPETEEWEHGQHPKEEEFARAVSLALFDYLRKSWSSGFVVSLSGGADSAAVSCLVALMVERGLQDLGLDGFIARLPASKLKDATTKRELVHRLLTTMYQASANSGPVTRRAAREVAEAIGAEHLEANIESLVKGYVELAEGALGRKLTWERDDLALQNIQARVRSPGIWMITNVKNALLLSTSNRSEAAVGYATMDGDTSGGVSPIAGIDKAFLRQWLVWLEKIGLQGSEPIPALSYINAQAPTAELRPMETNQTDEADLMPYPVLDAAERAAIRDKLTPIEVFERLRMEFPQYTIEQLGFWVERFFKLWCRNQWKRERYAPSFHVDDENLDPKTWCRFPILSGGFQAELDDLKAYVVKRSEVQGQLS